MEQSVSAGSVITLAANFDQRTVVVLIGDIEDLDEIKPILPSSSQVRLYVVQVAEQARESDMAGVVQSGLSEHQYAMLYSAVSLRLKMIENESA